MLVYSALGFGGAQLAAAAAFVVCISRLVSNISPQRQRQAATVIRTVAVHIKIHKNYTLKKTQKIKTKTYEYIKIINIYKTIIENQKRKQHGNAYE